MGTITLSKANRLFWLGRYLERAYASIKATKPIFETETDGDEADFALYCNKLRICGSYENTSDFIRRYYFDPENLSSITASLNHAYDNAMVLRETLSSETLAYVQMAVSAMEFATTSASPGVELQWVLDDIMAFRGACEENIDEEGSRNIIKTGTSLERVDIYIRLGYDPVLCEKEFSRLFNRLYKTKLNADKDKLELLLNAFLYKTGEVPPLDDLLIALGGLFPEM